jgi:hypothetical protein
MASRSIGHKLRHYPNREFTVEPLLRLRIARAGYITGQNLLLDGGDYSGVP